MFNLYILLIYIIIRILYSDNQTYEYIDPEKLNQFAAHYFQSEDIVPLTICTEGIGTYEEFVEMALNIEKSCDNINIMDQTQNKKNKIEQNTKKYQEDTNIQSRNNTNQQETLKMIDNHSLDTCCTNETKHNDISYPIDIQEAPTKKQKLKHNISCSSINGHDIPNDKSEPKIINKVKNEIHSQNLNINSDNKNPIKPKQLKHPLYVSVLKSKQSQYQLTSVSLKNKLKFFDNVNRCQFIKQYTEQESIQNKLITRATRNMCILFAKYAS